MKKILVINTIIISLFVVVVAISIKTPFEVRAKTLQEISVKQEVSTYGLEYYFIATNDRDNVAKLVQKVQDCYGFDFSSNTKGAVITKSGYPPILWVKNVSDEPELNAILAHEIFHLTAYIMEIVEIPFVFNISEEAWAYLVGEITENIYSELLWK